MNTDQQQTTASTLRFSEVTDRIIGVFYAVYNELGYGFLESVYQRAMFIALQSAGLAVTTELAVPV